MGGGGGGRASREREDAAVRVSYLEVEMRGALGDARQCSRH